MANFYGQSLTDEQFQTKNNSLVANVFMNLGYEESFENDRGVFIGSFENTTPHDDMIVLLRGNGDNLLDVICGYDGSAFGSIEEYNEEYNCNIELPNEYTEMPVTDWLQAMLLDDEICVMHAIGNEKLRYFVQESLVISKKEIKYFNHAQTVADYVSKCKENK